MFAERLSIKIAVIVLAVFWLGACGSNKGEWSGKISGDVRISDSLQNAANASPFYKGNDTITLQPAESYYLLEFGKNSSIQNCQITFVFDAAGTAESKVAKRFKFRRAGKLPVYGEKDTGLPCRGVVDAAGTIADIVIENNSVVSAKDTGNYEVSIQYKPVGSTKPEPLYYQMLLGTKGWF